MLQQEIIRFAVIFTWNLISTIVRRILSDSPFVNIDVPLENAVAIILTCRFTMELRKRNFFAAEASIALPVTDRQSVGGHHAIFSRIHDGISSSFGDNERMVNCTADELEDVDGRRTSAVDGPTEVTLANNEGSCMPSKGKEDLGASGHGSAPRNSDRRRFRPPTKPWL